MCCMAVVYLHIFLFSFLQVYTSLLFSNNQYYMYYMYVCAVWQLYICIFSYFFFFFCRFIQVCSSAIIYTICMCCMAFVYLHIFLFSFLQVYTSLLFSNNQYYMYYMYVCAVWQLYISIFFFFAGLYKSALQQ